MISQDLDVSIYTLEEHCWLFINALLEVCLDSRPFTNSGNLNAIATNCITALLAPNTIGGYIRIKKHCDYLASIPS